MSEDTNKDRFLNLYKKLAPRKDELLLVSQYMQGRYDTTNIVAWFSSAKPEEHEEVCDLLSKAFEADDFSAFKEGAAPIPKGQADEGDIEVEAEAAAQEETPEPEYEDSTPGCDDDKHVVTQDVTTEPKWDEDERSNPEALLGSLLATVLDDKIRARIQEMEIRARIQEMEKRISESIEDIVRRTVKEAVDERIENPGFDQDKVEQAVRGR
jgi:hypothetical protein